MKTFLAAFAIAVTLSRGASAAPIRSSDILGALISDARAAVLVGEDGHVLKQDLVSILSDALASQTMAPIGKFVRIVSVSGQCEPTDAGHGQEYFDCSCSVSDGDYERTSSGYEGPQAEGSIHMKFKGVRKTPIGDEKTELRVNSRITVSFVD